MRHPAWDQVCLVDSNYERCSPILEDGETFMGLGLEASVDVDDQDGDVCYRASSSAEVKEDVVSGGVNNEEARNAYLCADF